MKRRKTSREKQRRKNEEDEYDTLVS